MRPQRTACLGVMLIFIALTAVQVINVARLQIGTAATFPHPEQLERSLTRDLFLDRPIKVAPTELPVVDCPISVDLDTSGAFLVNSSLCHQGVTLHGPVAQLRGSSPLQHCLDKCLAETCCRHFSLSFQGSSHACFVGNSTPGADVFTIIGEREWNSRLRTASARLGVERAPGPFELHPTTPKRIVVSVHLLNTHSVLIPADGGVRFTLRELRGLETLDEVEDNLNQGAAFAQLSKTIDVLVPRREYVIDVMVAVDHSDVPLVPGKRKMAHFKRIPFTVMPGIVSMNGSVVFRPQEVCFVIQTLAADNAVSWNPSHELEDILISCPLLNASYSALMFRGVVERCLSQTQFRGVSENAVICVASSARRFGSVLLQVETSAIFDLPLNSPTDVVSSQTCNRPVASCSVASSFQHHFFNLCNALLSPANAIQFFGSQFVSSQALHIPSQRSIVLFHRRYGDITHTLQLWAVEDLYTKVFESHQGTPWKEIISHAAVADVFSDIGSVYASNACSVEAEDCALHISLADVDTRKRLSDVVSRISHSKSDNTCHTFFTFISLVVATVRAGWP